MSKILVVEDERHIADIITFNLKREDMETDVAYDGKEGLEMALSGQYDLVLLDVMLPKMDGFEVLRLIRQKSNIPVIMVTAREEESDKILGLETGADDYITKPFSVKELSVRVRANIRRYSGNVMGDSEESDVVICGPFVLKRKLQVIEKDGRPIDLTVREFDLLCHFLNSPERVIPREELMREIWGYEYYGDMRVIDVAMRRLREKIEEDPANPVHILTRRGTGYYFMK